MGFQLSDSSHLKLLKLPIRTLAGLADHYYLSESPGFHDSVGWGPQGLELRGTVKVTPQQMERIERFMATARYSIAFNNCEHFANYVLHGLNLSSQQHVWWKNLGSEIISFLQPTQSQRENLNTYVNQQASEILQENLRQAKIERANRERIEFWKSRGIETK